MGSQFVKWEGVIVFVIHVDIKCTCTVGERTGICVQVVYREEVLVSQEAEGFGTQGAIVCGTQGVCG